MSKKEELDERRVAVLDQGDDGQQILGLPFMHKEINGVEMGVLKDGTPYLTSRGLARLCGVTPSTIIELNLNWSEHSQKPRGADILESLEFYGYTAPVLSSAIQVGGVSHNAHPDAVCMAVLEYYAFKAGKDSARRAFRILASKTLRDFIYDQVGYMEPTEEAWSNFRIIAETNMAPKGFFSIFKESSDLILTSIRHGLPLAPHTVPDISVGSVWGRYWRDNSFDSVHGERQKHPHKYPEHYPQSQAFPEAWVYPNASLGIYRDWFENVYLPDKYPAYLQGKQKKGDIGGEEMTKLLRAIEADLSNQLPE